MAYSVLGRSQVEQFVEKGYTVLKDAFPRSVAAEVRKCIWKKLKLSPEEPSSWTKPVIHIRRNFKTKPYTDAFTPRVLGAFDDLMGENRWVRQMILGWWPVAFPGFEKKAWHVPADGWHVDGSHFQHHLTSREQGLLPIFIFSDIETHGGGTALSEGSQRITARILAEAGPEGLSMEELSSRILKYNKSCKSVIEATGNAGDVVLIHPFLLHARSPNCGSSVRFICNPCFGLHEPLNLKRSKTAERSPVELAIINSLRD
jgi:hypothetical protein